MMECLEALRSKSYKKCAELAEKAALSSESTEAQALAHELVGTFQFLRGDIKAAGSSLSKALEIQPNESNVLVKLALVELEHNDFPKMTEFLEKAFAADPKNPALYYHRGEILALSGNLEGAIRDFSCAVELCPDFHLAYVHNSRALLGLHKIEEAEEALLEALKHYPDSAEVQNGYGEVLVMKGEYSAAEKVFDSIIKKDPAAIQVYLNKALLAMNQSNDVTSAEMHLRAAIKLDPSFMAAHLQLANLLLSNGKTSESMQHFDDALKYARTLQELVSVHSLRCASMAQVQIAERFPTLASKMK
jgi:import receptor subunit TOM70